MQRRSPKAEAAGKGADFKTKIQCMNLSDYFFPVDFSAFQKSDNLPEKHTLGYVVQKQRAAFSDASLKKMDVALIGVPFDDGEYCCKKQSAPDIVRNQLYQLSAFSNKICVADLGNLKPARSKKGMNLALRDIVEYLLGFGVLSVAIGGSQDLTIGICEAFRGEPLFWLTAIDSVFDIKKGVEKSSPTNFLTPIFRNFTNLFQFSLLGYQNHLVSDSFLEKTEGLGEHLRLGKFRDNPSQAELILRNSHVVSFDLGAVKSAEAPSTVQKNPNGLRSEEACQLARYAGLSNSIKAFGLFGGQFTKTELLSPKLASEIIWYFLQGVSQRTGALKKIVYRAEIEGLDNPVVFKKDEASGQWWFEIRSITGKIMEIACSEEDYRLAASNEIPERWLSYVQKLDSF